LKLRSFSSSANKKPSLATGLLISIRRTLSGSLIRHSSVVAVGFDIRLVGFAVSFGRLGLGASGLRPLRAARPCPPGVQKSGTAAGE
jgi:hypothetical protein